ncbi:MAG: hypothetical protein WBR18_02000 [Anaerolineales bacterium]
MIRARARLRAVGLDPYGRPTATILYDPATLPAPGQALLATPLLAPPAIPFSLYPIQLNPDGFRCLVPNGQRWLPGDEIDLLGPIGRGFAPPERARRWLLVGADDGAGPLTPLIDAALASDAAVALTCPHPPADLAADVELLASADEALDWADYLAINLGSRPIADLRSLIGRPQPSEPPCPTDVLLPWDLPCGFGGCLSCGLPTSNGWKLACRHGPVIPWGDLRV